MSDRFGLRTDQWAERYVLMISDLLPRLRRLSPELSERALRQAAERIAQYRLAGEELSRGLR